MNTAAKRMPVKTAVSLRPMQKSSVNRTDRAVQDQMRRGVFFDQCLPQRGVLGKQGRRVADSPQKQQVRLLRHMPRPRK